MQNKLTSDKTLLALLAPENQLRIHLLDTVDSTNSEAKRYCLSGGELPALFIARGQTGGRGRLGRSFDSSYGKGLYMTLALKPKSGTTPHSLTLTAGCATLLAIRELTGAEPEIKWVNDIEIQNKKVSGILAEGAFDADGNMSYAIVGVGVNIRKRDFPPELAERAGTLEELTGYAPDEAVLAANIANRFFSLSRDFSSALAVYRERLNTLSRRILVLGVNTEYTAKAIDIDEEGNLIIMLDDGSYDKLFFGEISVINQ